MGDVTPDQIATFDQALADAENNLDVLIDLWRTGDPDSPEHIRIAGLCVALGERPEWDRIALAEHLTVAIRRLDRAGQAATPDGPHRWASQVPAEPGPDVLAVQIVETGQRWERRYAKDQPDRWAWDHWLLEWSQLLCAWAVGHTLTDATPAADGQDGDGRG